MQQVNSNVAQGGSVFLLNGCVMDLQNAQMAQTSSKNSVVSDVPVVNTNFYMFLGQV